MPRSALLPGDLIFFASGSSWQSVHHVGMYLGGGKMVHAPTTGDVVKVSTVWWSRFYAATRVYGAVPSLADHPADDPAAEAAGRPTKPPTTPPATDEPTKPPTKPPTEPPPTTEPPTEPPPRRPTDAARRATPQETTDPPAERSGGDPTRRPPRRRPTRRAGDRLGRHADRHVRGLRPLPAYRGARLCHDVTLARRAGRACARPAAGREAAMDEKPQQSTTHDPTQWSTSRRRPAAGRRAAAVAAATAGGHGAARGVGGRRLAGRTSRHRHRPTAEPAAASEPEPDGCARAGRRAGAGLDAADAGFGDLAHPGRTGRKHADLRRRAGVGAHQHRAGCRARPAPAVPGHVPGGAGRARHRRLPAGTGATRRSLPSRPRGRCRRWIGGCPRCRSPRSRLVGLRGAVQQGGRAQPPGYVRPEPDAGPAAPPAAAAFASRRRVGRGRGRAGHSRQRSSWSAATPASVEPLPGREPAPADAARGERPARVVKARVTVPGARKPVGRGASPRGAGRVSSGSARVYRRR